MPVIDPTIACHKLHVNPTAKHVIQKMQHFLPKRVAIIEAEIDKLLKAEASNKTIIDCLKKSLLDNKGKWTDELPGVLWAYHTTKRCATGETPFSLAYSSEAIIYPNIMVPSISIVLQNLKQNEKEMATNLNLTEENGVKVITRIAAYQQQLFSSYNKRAKIRQFQP
ncbi:uncharacterized protein [Malus domestica]|uniref:uncharacterized protein n=1 Tax=Malus domestica TaxID=3750 RepID=UPI00397531B5